MKLLNLSTLNEHFVIEVAGKDGPEYWAHSHEYYVDINHPSVAKFNKRSVEHWVDWHARRGINAHVRPVEHFHTLIQWPDHGWIVIVPDGRGSTIHNVYLAGNYGDGWFMKDEGTTERLLCLNNGVNSYDELKVQGKNLGELTTLYKGKRFKASSFTVPTDSDLCYLFTYNPKPLEYI